MEIVMMLIGLLTLGATYSFFDDKETGVAVFFLILSIAIYGIAIPSLFLAEENYSIENIQQGKTISGENVKFVIFRSIFDDKNKLKVEILDQAYIQIADPSKHKIVVKETTGKIMGDISVRQGYKYRLIPNEDIPKWEKKIKEEWIE